MKTLLLSLLLFAIAACVRSQVKLLQTGAAQVKPSQTLRLTCSVSGFSLTSSGYGVSWVRQPRGKGLEWLSTVDWEDDKYYQESLKNRLTISRDTSKSEVYLQMRGMEAGDSGIYYCASFTVQNAFDYWGQGTTVTVSSASRTAPSVFPLTSCTGDDTPQVTFGCLAKGYFPEPVTVTWSPNVTPSGVKTYPSLLQPSSGLYTLSSQVTVPSSSWESNTYSCNVEHQPTSSSISKEIPKGQYSEPKVEVLHSCTAKPGTVQLVCLISGFSPEPFTVEWLVDGKRGVLHGDTDSAKKDADGRTFTTRSNASVSQDEWLEGKTYTCHVHQPDTKTTSQDHARKCEGDSHSR